MVFPGENSRPRLLPKFPIDPDELLSLLRFGKINFLGSIFNKIFKASFYYFQEFWEFISFCLYIL